jgi:hypothetical protein
MIPVAKYLKRHNIATDNNTNYTPTFTDGSGHGTVGGSIGTWTPTYFAVHNHQSTSVQATVWTVEQGTAGSGALILIGSGETVYVNVAKINPGANVTLFGTLNTPMVY